MAFMRILTTCDTWYTVETRNGTDYVPASVCGDLGLPLGEEIDDDSPLWAEAEAAVRDYCEGKPQSIEYIGEQWAARYSAPGYMDCTDWVLADTKQEAIAECQAMYGDDEEEEPEEEEDEPNEPTEGDILYTYSGVIHCEGTEIGRTREPDEVIRMVRQWTKENNYFPGLWADNGGGNWALWDYSEPEKGN